MSLPCSWPNVVSIPLIVALGRQRPYEPTLERLLDNDEETLITWAVEQDVDRGSQSQEEVGDEGADLYPLGPHNSDFRLQQGVHKLFKQENDKKVIH